MRFTMTKPIVAMTTIASSTGLSRFATACAVRLPSPLRPKTVSVKIGHAVVRNRARRRLREVYRLNAGRLRQGYDVVLVARGRTLTASWKELNDTFLRLCRKLDLMEVRPS